MMRSHTWLSLAAAPTFMAMAVLSAFAPEPASPLCAPGHASPLTGMTAMYLLMAAFHTAPWLGRLDRSRRPEGRGE